MSRLWRKQTERSTPFALMLIRGIALRTGRLPTRLLLLPIVAYFLLTSRSAARSSRQYLTRLQGREASFSDVARHLHCFASTILDRVFFLTDRFDYFNIDIIDKTPLIERVKDGHGALLLVSHLGSFEALRAMAAISQRLPIKIVMNRSQNAAITQMLEALSPGILDTVIDTSVESTMTLIKIKEAIDEGYMVALMADRVHSEHERTCLVEFLGHPATLPVTPMMVAAAIGAPAYLCFGLYQGGNHYELHFEEFAERVVVKRRNRDAELTGWVQKFADRLEHYARMAPYNWFNFYDYWNRDEDRQTRPASARVDSSSGR